MRESNTKIMKSMLRIAIFSIGGVITIFGIMFCLYCLVQLFDDLSEYMPYFFGAVLTLSVGLSLYFLSIKPMRYFVKSRKMSREEKVIHNIKTYMKQRKSRIAGITFLFIFMLSISIWMMWTGNKLSRTMTTEHFRVLNLAKLMIYQWHFSLFTGFIIAILILEIGSVIKDKHMLTINMWERIQELEDEVKELKAQTQADGQQVADVDGSDIT